MKNKFKINGSGGVLWLLALAVILALGIYLTKDGGTSGAVQTFGGGYNLPNRSFADLFYR